MEEISQDEREKIREEERRKTMKEMKREKITRSLRLKLLRVQHKQKKQNQGDNGLFCSKFGHVKKTCTNIMLDVQRKGCLNY